MCSFCVCKRCVCSTVENCTLSYKMYIGDTQGSNCVRQNSFHTHPSPMGTVTSFLENDSQRRTKPKDDCVPAGFELGKRAKPFQLCSVGGCTCIWFSRFFACPHLWRKNVTLQKSASSVEVKGQRRLQVLSLDELGDFGRAFQVKGIFQNTYMAGSLQVASSSTNINRGRKQWRQKINMPQAGAAIKILSQKII